MTEIANRYRKRADSFEKKVAAVKPDQWSNQSPCEDWDARGVVGHIIDMHAAMLRPFDGLSPAPSLDDDPLGAFRAARADVESVLDDPERAGLETDTPGGGRMTVEQHIDQVVSADLVLHGWDLARATGQDETIDPGEVEQAWAGMQQIPPEMMEKMRTPGAFGPGVVVFGPEVEVPEDAPLQDRLLGLLGRDPR